MILQFITHTNSRFDSLQGAIEALKGGARWIQLRMKESSDEEVESVGRDLLRYCREYGATMIIDDRVELAKRIGADGVHLGRNDMPPTQAREILGESAIIGGTANTFADIERLHNDGVNYIGLGPFRYTTTKTGLSPILGVEGYRKIITECRNRGIELPIVAIGGITRSDIASIMECGISGVALSGTILSADSPQSETSGILEELKLHLDKICK